LELPLVPPDVTVCTADAYARAGWKPNRANACAMRSKPDVVARVQEILAVGAEKAAVTVESLLRELEEARVAAMKDGQFSASSNEGDCAHVVKRSDS
jgi:hypothetical protein